MPRKSRLEPAFEPADALIGIASAMPVHRLIHYINQVTSLSIYRTDELPVFNEKSESLTYYDFCTCYLEDFRTQVSLVSNNSGNEQLIPALRQLNYFLMIQGSMPEEKIGQLVTAIKGITGVQLAALVKQETHKELANILQDLELHLLELKKKKEEEKRKIMPLSDDQ